MSRREITKEEFIKLYNTETNTSISKMHGVSRVTVIKWAKEFGLPKKGYNKFIKDVNK